MVAAAARRMGGKVNGGSGAVEGESGGGGNTTFSAGDSDDGSRNGGDVTFRAGDGVSGGRIEFVSGEGLDSSGGDIVLTVSPGKAAPGGPGRIEYLKLKAEPYPISRTASMVRSKSISLSPGNPTMKSEDSAISGRAARMRAIRSRYSA